MADDKSFGINQRLDQMDRAIFALQRGRRRWRTVAVTIGILSLVHYVLGAKEKPETAEFQTLTARELRVTDETGNIIFSVSCKDGLSTLFLTSPEAKDAGSVYLAAKRDQATVYANGGDRHSAGLTSSIKHNYLNLQTKTAETILISGGGEAGSIAISKTIDGKRSEKLWSAP